MMKALLATIACCLLAVATFDRAAAADIRVTPTFGVSEEITDNADESPSRRRAEFLTVLQPGTGINYATQSSVLTANYNLNYRYYARKTRGNEVSHTAALQGSFALIRQFLMLDISDTFSRVSLDIARDTTAETSYHNQTDQNTATISPYLLWRVGENTQARIGGRYTDIRYWSDDGMDKRETGAFAELTHKLSPRVELTGRYVFNKTNAKSGFDNISAASYRDHSASGGIKYEYAERSFIFATAGYSWQHFSKGKVQKSVFWDAGVSRQFETIMATLETKRRFVEDPLTLSVRQTTYAVRIDKTFPRSTLGLAASYDDYHADDETLDRHGPMVTLTGTREIGEKLASSLTLTGDRRSRRVLTDYPYHVTATGTLRYLLGPRTDVNLAYTYATYRYHLDVAKGSVESNRVIMQLKRAF